MRTKIDTFAAGYSGRDPMRENAKRMLGPELRATDMSVPESSSSVGRTKMRPFKKGGHATPGSKTHKLTKERTDLYIPKKVKSKPFKFEKMSVAEKRASGGAMMQRAKGGTAKKGGKQKFSFGGVMGEIMRSIPLVNMVTGPIADAAHLKRGGQPKKKKKFGLGGMALGMGAAPIVEKIPKVGKYMASNLGLFGHLLPFAEGGEASEEKMSKRHGGHCSRTRKAEGGEASAEKLRRGGRAKKRYEGGGEVDEPPLIKNAKIRWEENHPNGAPFSHGGEAKKKGGQIKKRYAIGGAGKVRKGQATPSGKPIKKRPSIKRG